MWGTLLLLASITNRFVTNESDVLCFYFFIVHLLSQIVVCFGSCVLLALRLCGFEGDITSFRMTTSRGKEPWSGWVGLFVGVLTAAYYLFETYRADIAL
jgi:hypothetical protein